jgi:hypothetical protein
MLSWSSNNQLIVSSSLLYRWCPDTHIWCNDYFINWKLNLIVSAGLSSAEQPFPCSDQQAVRQSSSQPACLLCPRQSTQGVCSPKAVWCESHHTLAPPASSRFLRLPLGLMLTLRRLVALVQLAVPAEVCLRRSVTSHTRPPHLFDGRLGRTAGGGTTLSADCCCAGCALVICRCGSIV